MRNRALQRTFSRYQLVPNNVGLLTVFLGEILRAMEEDIIRRCSMRLFRYLLLHVYFYSAVTVISEISFPLLRHNKRPKTKASNKLQTSDATNKPIEKE